ncbi:MAG TPA: hypothetical protein VF621_04205 [Pyrinomonadaceae bacterium]
MPDVKEPDASRLPVVPPGFGEEVERAAAGRRLGDLRLLAAEARGFEWETDGLRVVARAQFDLKDWRGAKSTWEAVRRLAPHDPEADLSLGTIYERLGGLTESTEEHGRALIFTGHMLDAPGREKPRFPADREGVARRKIREAVKAETATGGGACFGIAGGASGGDILFHEVCEELGVPTQLYLALLSPLYVNASVREAGGDWVERFRRLHARLDEEGKVRVLSGLREEPADAAEHLPAWLRPKPEYNIWQRTNLWMLHNALAAGDDDRVTLIALWDGEATGDGLGGTSDLVRQAGRRGAKTVIIDTKETFGL